MRTRNRLAMLAVCGLATLGLAARAAETTPAKEAPWLSAKPEIVEAWKDMRFGVFMCWGPVSLTGLEIGWSRGAPPWGVREGVRGGKGPTPVEVYDNLYKKWVPDKFNAREWIQLVKDAGAKYVIFLIKHHDGFPLFDTKLGEYKITGPESAWKVDVMKAIADACHELGIKLIVYYSQPDWHHPDFCGEHHERYIQYLHGQMRELLTNYGKIDGLWFDGLGAAAKQWDAENMFKLMRSIQPEIIINNRAGIPGDYDTPEQRIGAFQNGRPWESCCTITTQWAFKPDDTVKSLEDCIRMLVSCATGDGNLALNTGPMPDGRIDPREVARFREIGAWLKKNGESIYGTRGGPFRAPDENKVKRAVRQGFNLPGGGWWGGSTHKGNTIYLHIQRWPAEVITLPPVQHKVVKATLLGGGAAEVKQTVEGIEVRVAAPARDALDTIVKLELDGPAADIPATTPPGAASGSLALGGKAAASVVYRNIETYAADKAFDDNLDTRWGTNYDTRAAWLEVRLGGPKTFDRVWIGEYANRIKKFELQVQEGEQWRTFHRGTTIGESCEIKFAPVTGQRVRLNLTETDPGPSIYEFQIFPPNPATP